VWQGKKSKEETTTTATAEGPTTNENDSDKFSDPETFCSDPKAVSDSEKLNDRVHVHYPDPRRQKWSGGKDQGTEENEDKQMMDTIISTVQ